MYLSVEYEGKIYIFGGYNGKLGKHYNDLYIFDPGLWIVLIFSHLHSQVHLS